MKKMGCLILIGICLFCNPVMAAVGWEDDFDPIKATWVETSATWTDLTGSTAKLTESDPAQSYGVSASETITVDVSQYSQLVIVSTDVESGAYYSIQIQEIGGSGAYADAVSYMGTAGTQVVDIAALMGWSGTKSFVINVWIEGDNKAVTFDLLQIKAPDAGWVEDFDPIKLTWGHDETYWTDIPGPGAILTEDSPDLGVRWWGAAFSETMTLDIDTYNTLYIKTTNVESGCLYSVQIEEIGGAGATADAVSYQGEPAEHTIDIAALMDWSGVKTFRINIWLDAGNGGRNTTFDLLEVRQKTRTPIYWQDHFDPIEPTWLEVDAYWTYTPDSNAILTEDSANPFISYGKVESVILVADVNVFSEMTVVLTNVEASAYVDIGIMNKDGSNTYKDVVPTIYGPVSTPQTYTVDIPSAMGWTGTQTFRFVIWINGDGKSAAFDLIQLGMNCGPDVLPGDYCEDCIVDLLDLAYIGRAWLSEYGTVDLMDIAEYWLQETDY